MQHAAPSLDSMQHVSGVSASPIGSRSGRGRITAAQRDIRDLGDSYVWQRVLAAWPADQRWRIIDLPWTDPYKNRLIIEKREELKNLRARLKLQKWQQEQLFWSIQHHKEIKKYIQQHYDNKH